MTDHGALPWTEAEFDDLRRAVRDAAPGLAANALHKAARVIAAASEARDLLARLHAEALRPSVDDANVHLGRLVHTGFVLGSGIDRLDDIERYVRAIIYRLEHLAGAHDQDRRRMAEVAAARAALRGDRRHVPARASCPPNSSTCAGSSRNSASPRSPNRSWSSVPANPPSAPNASPPSLARHASADLDSSTPFAWRLRVARPNRNPSRKRPGGWAWEAGAMATPPPR